MKTLFEGMRFVAFALPFSACTYVPSEAELSAREAGLPSTRDAGEVGSTAASVAADGGPVGFGEHNHADHSHSDDELAEHEHASVEPDLLAAGRDVRDVSTQEPLPTLGFDIDKDPVTGWRLEARLENFELAPEASSSEHHDGRGHLHLHVDDELHAHVYGSFFFVPDLSVGEHRVRLELAGNDHLPLAVGEAVLGGARNIEQPDPDAPVRLHERHEDPTLNVTAEAMPVVTLALHPDAVVGYLLEIQTQGFELAPLNLSNFHVAGQGHFRLSVDGRERERVFSHWLQLRELELGDHEVTVELVSNDHRLYTFEGKPISASIDVAID